MKREMIKPSILSGFMELLPKEERIFEDIKKKIKGVYENNGCMQITILKIYCQELEYQ